MALLWVALFTLAGCNSEITTVPQGEQADGMMQVNLLVHTADYAVQTRANGSVKGVEGIGEGSMQLLCFDKGGYFLGMGQSVAIEANQTGDENNHLLHAVVYNSTARIHFLANANITMPVEIAISTAIAPANTFFTVWLLPSITVVSSCSSRSVGSPTCG